MAKLARSETVVEVCQITDSCQTTLIWKLKADLGARRSMITSQIAKAQLPSLCETSLFSKWALTAWQMKKITCVITMETATIQMTTTQ